MKVCQKCYEKKEIEFFGKDIQKIDGLSSYCKECNKRKSLFQRNRDKEKYKKYSKEYREKNSEKIREKSKIDYYINWEKRRKIAKESYEKRKKEIASKRAIKRKLESEKEKNRERQKKWRQENKSKFGEIVSGWKKRNPQKANAHALIIWAIKCGVLKRNEFCEQCNMKCKTEAHHIDYSKPMEVKWLCKSCHTNIHKIYR